MVTDNHSLPVLGKERENMSTLRWVFAVSFAGVMCAGTARAQTTLTSGVQQPGSIRQMAFQSDDFGYAITDSGTAAPASPSNAPPAPPAASGGTATTPEAPKEEEKKADDTPPPETPYRLFHNIGDFGQWEDCQHLEIRGFIDAGYTSNSEWPQNHYNGPVAYNDRANELDLNQIYLTAERLTKVENDCGVDYGYRMGRALRHRPALVQVLPGSQVGQRRWDNGNRDFYGSCPCRRHVRPVANQQADVGRRPLLCPGGLRSRQCRRQLLLLAQL